VALNKVLIEKLCEPYWTLINIRDGSTPEASIGVGAISYLFEDGKNMQCLYYQKTFQYKRDWVFNHFGYAAKLFLIMCSKIPLGVKLKFISFGEIMPMRMSPLEIRARVTVHGKWTWTYSPSNACGCSLSRILGCKHINASTNGRSKGADCTTLGTDGEAVGADGSLRAQTCVCLMRTSLLQAQTKT
jgi:hypothetical protein